MLQAPWRGTLTGQSFVHRGSDKRERRGEKRKKPEKAQENKNKGFLARLGPGLITGASDDDPSGIGTYSQAGAQLGFGIGWTMLLTYPLMAAIQEISARVGQGDGTRHSGQRLSQFSRAGASGL